jgi:hypothetical protein
MATTLTTHSLTVAKLTLASGTPAGRIGARIELRGGDPALVEEFVR